MRIFESYDQEAYAAQIINNIAVIYESNGHFEDAVSYFKRSLEVARKTGNPASTGNKFDQFGQFNSKNWAI